MRDTAQQWSVVVWGVLIALSCGLRVDPQASAQQTAPNPTFQSKVQVVLLDVVVTDKSGRPIVGLKKEDFEVQEGIGLGSGEQQSLASFEEHKGAPIQVQPRPSLPQHFYTNNPSAPSTDSINVLLLDALNTRSEDQAAVHREMITYLKSMDPVRRIAIFTLGPRLQMVEGFNSDPRVLLDALNEKKGGGQPRASTLLPSDVERDTDQKMLQAMADAQASAGAIEALKDFLSEVKGTERLSRTSLTLDGLREIAAYLSGFHGRKNLIWFSGSFPSIFTTRKELADDNGLGLEFKRTINLLASSQVAVYPVGAQGLEADPLLQANQSSPISVAIPDSKQEPTVGRSPVSGAPPASSQPLEQRVIQGTNERLSQDSQARNVDSEAADELAGQHRWPSFL